jgi:hypothetical protein
VNFNDGQKKRVLTIFLSFGNGKFEVHKKNPIAIFVATKLVAT